MKRIPVWFRTACIGMLAAHAVSAADSGWDVRLAEKFSNRLRQINQELKQTAPALEKLPAIPIDDQGGTGGFAAIYPTAEPTETTPHAIEIQWPEATAIDLLALVPTRRYDAEGLDPQYGTPDDFTVELINAKGAVVARVAREQNVRDNPVRRGHPFIYQFDPPVAAVGLRISANRLYRSSGEDGNFVHAWAEVFAFAGERNIARDAEVRGLGGATPPAPWRWKSEFLVDGETPLGLPEIPAQDHLNIGWLSNGRKNANESTSLTVDLGASSSVDSVRLIPAKRPTSDLPSGFGFPRKLVISVSETGAPGDAGKWSVVSERSFQNPGHNPVTIPLGMTRGRYVTLTATELWKAFEDYPAFLAFSEVEILQNDTNLALGKPVRSSDGMLNLIAPGGRYWSGAALSDGFGPEGPLVSTREWLLAFDQRLRIESRRHLLQQEAARVVNGWRNAALAVYGLLGLAGAFTLIALPIRYRIHANRQLVQIRERIASDLHDEVGSNLGSIQMFADLAESRSGHSEELKRIQRIAAETVSAVRDIVWLLRPKGDHRIATIEHLRETASIMLETFDWKFTANEEAWNVELAEESNRDLFLYFREALHNIARHAKAAKVEIRAERNDGHLRLIISDDGVGITPEKLDRPATLRALRQRATALDADLRADSSTNEGTRLTLTVPLDKKHLAKSRRPKP